MNIDNFVTTASQQQAAGENLIKTETTDAINTGIVDSADKTHKTVNQGIKSAAKTGITNGAEQALRTHFTKKTNTQSSIDETNPFQDEIHPTTQAKQRIVKGTYTKSIGAGVVTTLGTQANQKLLENTELEGLYDLYYKGKRSIKITKKAVSTTIKTGKTLSNLAEKNYRNQAVNHVQTQITGYMRKNIARIKNFHSLSAKAKFHNLAAGTGKAISAGSGKIIALVSGLIVPILIITLIVGMIGMIAAMSASDKANNESITGLPAWVTYDLVEGAFEGHEQYGYPVGALIGQMILENGSNDEGSKLGREAYNYGGIKYTGNTYGGLITGGMSLPTMECDIYGDCKTVTAQFAIFKDNKAFLEYRHKYLLQQANYTSQPNYQKAIQNNDSPLFLRALGDGGYYTANKDEYVNTYISLTETFPILNQFDHMSLEDFKNSFANFSVRGQDYAKAEDYQRKIVDAAIRTPSPPPNLCATWVSQVYNNAGLGWPTGNGNSMLNGYPTSTDFSKIKVGQIISAQYYPYGLGTEYGHIGIYVGDNMVMDSTGTINKTPLNEWIAKFKPYGWVKYGWPWN